MPTAAVIGVYTIFPIHKPDNKLICPDIHDSVSIIITISNPWITINVGIRKLGGGVGARIYAGGDGLQVVVTTSHKHGIDIDVPTFTGPATV